MKSDNKELLFGKKALLDAINNQLDIAYVITLKHHQILKEINITKHLEIKYENENYFKKYSHVNHQYLITVINNKMNHLTLDELISKYQQNQKVTILMLDENEDPRNFGAILRSAAAFNVNAVIYKNNHQAPINDLVIKTSMGAIYYLDLVKVANLTQAINKLQANGYWVYASSLTKDSIDLEQVKFDDRAVIILGNENNGIKPLVLKNSDFVIKIAMSNYVQSLNIAVACGIILYHRFKQN